MEPGRHVMCVVDSDNSFYIRAFYENDTRYEEIGFASSNINSICQYPLKKSTPSRVYFRNWKNNEVVSSNYQEIIEDGMLTITVFDVTKRIVSGTFWFKLQKNDGTIVEATDGRFDIKMN